MTKHASSSLPRTSPLAPWLGCIESNAKEKRLGKDKFIGYTGTVAVSLDFTEEVHRVYAFPNKLASASREVLQGTLHSRTSERRQRELNHTLSIHTNELEPVYDSNTIQTYRAYRTLFLYDTLPD